MGNAFVSDILYQSEGKGELSVGMQAVGDVMIGQHGRSVHEAIPALIVGQMRFSHSFSFLSSSSSRIKLVNQLNQRLCD